MPLEPTLAFYAATADCLSEAACRTPIDLVLFECVGELILMVSISALFVILIT
jgi:hypothetical protein